MSNESILDLSGQEPITLGSQDQFAPRSHVHQDDNDTSVLVTVASEDRKPPHGTMITQLILYVDEAFKVRRGRIGKCPHCHRDLHVRVVAERLH